MPKLSSIIKELNSENADPMSAIVSMLSDVLESPQQATEFFAMLKNIDNRISFSNLISMYQQDDTMMAQAVSVLTINNIERRWIDREADAIDDCEVFNLEQTVRNADINYFNKKGEDK